MNGTSKDAGSGLSNDGINRGLQVVLSNEWNQQWFYRWFCQMYGISRAIPRIKCLCKLKYSLLYIILTMKVGVHIWRLGEIDTHEIFGRVALR
jgi:hypothetical protein